MLPRLAIVALFAFLTLSACSGNEEEDPSEAQATPEASYPLATIAEPFGLNTEFYNVASEVPGFAGLSVTQTQDALNIFMSDPSTDIETIRAGMIKYMSDAQRFGDWEMHIVPVRYSWRQLYDWYQELTIIVSEVDGLIYSDINEGRNLLEFAAVDEKAQEAMEARIADYDIPEDAVIVEVTGPFIDD